MLNKVITMNRLKRLKDGKKDKKLNCKKNLHCVWVKQLKKKRDDLVKNWVNGNNKTDGTGALARKFM